MEKGYRDYGHDIDNTDVLEAGLGFAVDLSSQARRLPRQGRRAGAKAAGPLTRRLVQLRVLDPEPLLFHAEVVWRDDRAVGYVRAGSYGHTLGGAVGLAMVDAGGAPVDAAYLASGRWTVEIAGARYPIAVSLRPMYDPDSARIKG
jgi:glycine cleavage system aminomethyltransferase T